MKVLKCILWFSFGCLFVLSIQFIISFLESSSKLYRPNLMCNFAHVTLSETNNITGKNLSNILMRAELVNYSQLYSRADSQYSKKIELADSIIDKGGTISNVLALAPSTYEIFWVDNHWILLENPNYVNNDKWILMLASNYEMSWISRDTALIIFYLFNKQGGDAQPILKGTGY